MADRIRKAARSQSFGWGRVQHRTPPKGRAGRLARLPSLIRSKEWEATKHGAHCAKQPRHSLRATAGERESRREPAPRGWKVARSIYSETPWASSDGYRSALPRSALRGDSESLRGTWTGCWQGSACVMA